MKFLFCIGVDLMLKIIIAHTSDFQFLASGKVDKSEFILVSGRER